MAVCVALQVDGTLLPTGETVESCTGYVLVSGSEHSFYALVHEAFAQPTPEQVAAWFGTGFSAVLLMFVVARMAGTVASMFSNR